VAATSSQRVPTSVRPPPQERVRVGVIGGGAWGTALARHCAHMGHDTQLWAREPEVVEGVNDPAVKENTTYLKARPACCLAAPRRARLSCPGLRPAGRGPGRRASWTAP